MAFCTQCGAQNQDNTQFCTRCGTALSAGPGATTAGPAAPSVPPITQVSVVQVGPLGLPYATWADRVIGYLIDSVLVGIVMFVLYLVLGGFAATIGGLGARNLGGGLCCLMIITFPVSTLLVGLFNRVYLVAQRGSSIGQGVMNLKVVDQAGNLLTMGTAFLRLLAQVALAIIPLGSVLDLLWPLWDERRQTLHDKAVGAYVLKVS